MFKAALPQAQAILMASIIASNSAPSLLNPPRRVSWLTFLYHIEVKVARYITITFKQLDVHFRLK